MKSGHQGQADLRVTGRRDAGETLRRDDADLVAQLAEGLDRRLQCSHDTVGLRLPGVGRDRDLQAASATSCVVVRRAGYRPSGHRSNCSSPSRVSISAEQDSTQSPVLQYTVPSIRRKLARCMWPQTIPSYPSARAWLVATSSKRSMYR